ncbi:flagellar hook protein FlgE [Pengzhenrongella sicca]|uniref:Flagellar hook protein FlgE n=1 Tax=Pengzhenrongella sicca TaxID=2819238 RepID=A0A8A4ZH69_9MICO|nr:flagellar hook protein FlgE [Pengzhenrongella sicca]QTE29876.1 flagellar hook protein FlgE [Pengzhenrongella sicca]
MLRSLFSGISGLKAHQTMLDVSGNNIANVNTTGYKSSQTQFQDTLSQVISTATAGTNAAGGTNPAQVGLGVRVAGITTNFTQGAAQLTNVSTDMMISGDGFFTVRSGAQTLFTRAGGFSFDSTGHLVTASGAFVQGWAATDGAINTNGGLSDLQLPTEAMGAKASTAASFTGNVPTDADGTAADIVRTIDVFDNLGQSRTVTLTFSNTAAGAWSVAASDGSAAVAATPLAFDAAGKLTSPTSLALGAVAVDIGAITGFASLSTLAAGTQDGQEAGTLQSFALSSDGTLMGSYSNGLTQAIGQLALATFNNPAGLEKTGDSMYTTSVNSGAAEIGTAGTGGRGSLANGALEMSNVDLSSEFTNLIIAQRGFQANARVITTSDSLLEELVNLKR